MEKNLIEEQFALARIILSQLNIVKIGTKQELLEELEKYDLGGSTIKHSFTIIPYYLVTHN